MTTLRRFFGLFTDSPTYDRDRSNLISGFTIGTTGILLNAAVMFLFVPLLFDEFQDITENVEFGQLLALILLGGAAGFATFLIPLRLASVFWGPRIGRYFDQIVLSGISPFRFVIGKVTSQNLFLGLILFLLTPYLVLSLALGGVDPVSFFAGLFLVWLYCMTLAVVTIWASLYFNELLAAIFVVAGAAFFSGLGFIPAAFQPCVITPFPALIHPVYAEIPEYAGSISPNFVTVFLSCTLGMSTVIGFSLLAIHLGPLYGIIRDNSTFGEVVRAGDSKRKRWLRLRLHIQRPSEIAFFYENRGAAFCRHEGIIRWGQGLCALSILLVTVIGFFVYAIYKWPPPPQSSYWRDDVAISCLVVHGMSVALAAYLFSHARNTTCLRIPLIAGKRVEAGRLDTFSFLLFLSLSTGIAVGTPFLIDQILAQTGQSMFGGDSRSQKVDYMRAIFEGTLIITVAGLLVYVIHRRICMATWMKTTALFTTAIVYFAVICLVPFLLAVLYIETNEYFDFPFAEWTPSLAITSPITAIANLFNEMGRKFPKQISSVPFYIVHAVLIVLFNLSIRRRAQIFRQPQTLSNEVVK